MGKTRFQPSTVISNHRPLRAAADAAAPTAQAGGHGWPKAEQFAPKNWFHVGFQFAGISELPGVKHFQVRKFRELDFPSSRHFRLPVRSDM